MIRPNAAYSGMSSHFYLCGASYNKADSQY